MRGADLEGMTSPQVRNHVRDESLHWCRDAPDHPTTLPPTHGRPSGKRVCWVSEGSIEALSDHWLFLALANSSTLAETEKVREEIRARGFILSIDDLRGEDVVDHSDYGWCQVLEWDEEVWTAIAAGGPVPSVWLYPENKPSHVPYDANGYVVEVQFAGLTRGQMRHPDGRSPLIPLVST